MLLNLTTQLSFMLSRKLYNPPPPYNMCSGCTELGKFKCPLCNFISKKVYSLLFHFKYVHFVESFKICPLCRRELKYKKNIHVHYLKELKKGDVLHAFYYLNSVRGTISKYRKEAMKLIERLCAVRE